MERNAFSSSSSRADRDRGVRAFLRDEVLNKPKRAFAAFLVCSEIVLFVVLATTVIFRSGGDGGSGGGVGRPDAERIDAIAEKLRRLKNSFEKFHDVLSLPLVDGGGGDANETRSRDAIDSSERLLDETIAALAKNKTENVQNSIAERNCSEEEIERCFEAIENSIVVEQTKLTTVLENVWRATADWTAVIDGRRTADTAATAEDWKAKLENATIEIHLQATNAKSTLADLFAFLKEIKNCLVDDDDDGQ